MHNDDWENIISEPTNSQREPTPASQTGEFITPQNTVSPSPAYYASFYSQPQKQKMSRDAKIFIVLMCLLVFLFIAAFATYPLWRSSVLGNIGGF